MSKEDAGAPKAGRKPTRKEANGVLYRAAHVGAADGEGELKEVEYDSVEEALHHACRDIRAGYKPIGIWAPDRSLIHGAAAIRQHCNSDAAHKPENAPGQE